MRLLDNQSFEDLYDQLDRWGQEYYKWYSSPQESLLIINFLKSIWDEIIQRKDTMEEETIDCLNLFAEEYPNFDLKQISL